MSPEAESAWKASEEYIALVLKLFEQPRPQISSQSLSAKKEGYRVSFLFPDLPERSRRDLCKVRCRFLGVDKTRERQKDEDTLSVEAGFEYQEADALEYQREAQDALMGFSKTQQEILREKFFVQAGS